MASVRISQRLASARKRDNTPESPSESEEPSEPQKKKRVFKSRKYWTQEEEQELLKRYRNGDEVSDIAAVRYIPVGECRETAATNLILVFWRIGRCCHTALF